MARKRGVLRQLPHALLATLLVVVAPPAIVFLALPGTSTLVAVVVCGLLTLAMSRAGDLLWRRRTQSQEILFADLMLWGWARRVRTEIQLERAADLFTPDDGRPSLLTPERRLAGLERLTQLLESRDAYTHRHSLRVTRYSEGIARGLGLPAEDVARIRTAAALHDVGKFLTPREILNKPGGLTDAEFAVVKRHPGEGASLLAGLVDPEIAAIVRHHHERLSGKGYPDGLAGDAIPLGARIIAVADTFDAMTSTRAYRSARSHKSALAVLTEEAGAQLDAAVVTAFVAYYSGRRGMAVSSLANGAGQALREVVGSAGLARIVPTLGASAALTAPLLTAAAPGLPTRGAKDPVKRDRVATVAKRTTPTTATEAERTSGTRASRPRRQGDTSEQRRSRAERPDSTRPTRPSASATPTASRPGSNGVGVGESTQQQQQTNATEGAPPATSTPAPAATSAPTSAPTAAPDVAVAPVTVQAGDIELSTPPITVDLPDLPVAIPTIVVEIPPIKLP